jgi:hypothetical protein
MEMRSILLLLVLILNLLGIGCKSLTRSAIQASQSAFLAQFSLPKTLVTINAPGLDCSKFGEGGGIGASAGGKGSGGVSHSQSHSTFCGIERPEGFQEAGFIQSLKTEIERQIQSSGAQVRGSRYSGGNGFQIEYAEGKIQGKVEITGQRQESTYIVTTNIEENN